MTDQPWLKSSIMSKRGVAKGEAALGHDRGLQPGFVGHGDILTLDDCTAGLPLPHRRSFASPRRGRVGVGKAGGTNRAES